MEDHDVTIPDPDDPGVRLHAITALDDGLYLERQPFARYVVSGHWMRILALAIVYYKRRSPT